MNNHHSRRGASMGDWRIPQGREGRGRSRHGAAEGEQPAGMPRVCAGSRNVCGWTVPFFDSARAQSLDRVGRDLANASTRSFLGRSAKWQFAH